MFCSNQVCLFQHQMSSWWQCNMWEIHNTILRSFLLLYLTNYKKRIVGRILIDCSLINCSFSPFIWSHSEPKLHPHLNKVDSTIHIKRNMINMNILWSVVTVGLILALPPLNINRKLCLFLFCRLPFLISCKIVVYLFFTALFVLLFCFLKIPLFWIKLQKTKSRASRHSVRPRWTNWLLVAVSIKVRFLSTRYCIPHAHAAGSAVAWGARAHTWTHTASWWFTGAAA